MKDNFRKKVLKNGMTVFFEKRDLPIVSVIFAVRNGSNNESLEEKGISHFIEHLLYKGTKNRAAKQIAEDIEKNGGEMNGFTSEEITAYWCKMPSRELNLALEVLSDLVKNPLFDEKELEKERQVIFEEIKMYHDNPRLYVFDEIQKSLYDGTMSENIAGNFESMKSIDRKKMVEKFNQIYKPNNMILGVVGNADFDKIVEFAEKNFGDEKGEVPVYEFGLKNESRIEKRKGIDQASLVFGFHSPLPRERLNPAAKVLITLMAGGMSSRLFSEIREKRNLAYAVKGGLEDNRDYSYSWIYVGTMKQNVEEVEKIILEEFKKVSEDLTEEELESVKKQVIGNYNISVEESQTQMVNLLVSEIQGKAEDFYDFEMKISEVNLEDVKKLASEVKEGKYSFFALVPEE
jgi:predicted Zn-dependent peptidase